jgi:hypothetical protein
VTGFVERTLALGAAALLAGVLALALSDRGSGSGSSPSTAPRPAVGPGLGWYAVRAGVAERPSRRGRRTSCGWLVVRGTLGVVHPVLPCGARIFITYRGTRALTRVVAHGPVPQGRGLDLMPRLARRIGFDGVREIQWAFARAD